MSGLAFTKGPVSYTHLRAHETVLDLVCRLLLEKKKKIRKKKKKKKKTKNIIIIKKIMEPLHLYKTPRPEKTITA